MSTTGATPGGPRLRPEASRARRRADGITAVEAFSRGDAVDPGWMGWGALRVLSRQDWAPAAVRDEGRVANVERLLLVLSGALAIEGGALGRIAAATGEAAWIGAGHGCDLRLANASDSAPLRLVELWLQPDRVNAAPALGAWLPPGAGTDGWVAVAGGARDAIGHPGPGAGVLPIRQRARVFVGEARPGAALVLPPLAGGRAWLEVLAGSADTGGGRPSLAAGDGLGWQDGDPGAPHAVAPAGAAPARLLLVALPD